MRGLAFEILGQDLVSHVLRSEAVDEVLDQLRIKLVDQIGACQHPIL